MTEIDQAAAVIDALRGFRIGDIVRCPNGRIGELSMPFSNPEDPDVTMRGMTYWSVVYGKLGVQNFRPAEFWYESELTHAD
jgi:hypothetical protein